LNSPAVQICFGKTKVVPLRAYQTCHLALSKNHVFCGHHLAFSLVLSTGKILQNGDPVQMSIDWGIIPFRSGTPIEASYLLIVVADFFA
jgi:hypothetical protein